MNVLLVSTYHGGSHAAWAHGLQRHCAHDIERCSLPDRFWKWRMHGGAVTLARRFLQADGAAPKLILATDMLDLTTFLALTRRVTAGIPALMYMHENQLTYPLPEDPGEGPMRRQKGERDRHYAFVNYASMLAADRVVFNSRFHRDAWFDELPRFLRHFPEHKELGTVDGLRRKSTVLPVGIDCPPATAAAAQRRHVTPGEPPLVLWNQRWEYDKNPGELVEALRRVAGRGVDFRLALCGQAFSESSADLQRAADLFGDRLVHFGFAAPGDYRRLLRQAHVTVSTARHEFFGVAVLEAMAHATFAVLPDRLAYPELLAGAEVSAETRARCLYGSHEELVEGLAWALLNPEESGRMGAELAANARRYCWPMVAPAYDALLEEVARSAA